MIKKPLSLVKKATKYVPGASYYTAGQNLPPLPEFILHRGNGAYVYTTKNEKMLDVTLAHSSLILGHNHPAVSNAVKNQIDKGSAFTNITEPAIELSEIMSKTIPCAEKIRLVNSGTEASILATRIVRAYTGKNLILKFEGAYHGFADNLLFNTNYGNSNNWDNYPSPTPDSIGIPKSLKNDILIAPYNDLSKTKSIILNNKANIAGIIIEPVMRGLETNKSFIEGIKNISINENIPLIFDEVITGYRLSLGGAQEFFGVTPDIAIYGKALGAGYPIGAITGNKKIMNLLNPKSSDENRIFSIGSFHSNPISSTAALMCIKELQNPENYIKLNEFGDNLRSGLSQIFSEYKIPHFMTGAGSIVEFFFTSNTVSNYRDTLKTNLKLKSLLSNQLPKNFIVGGGGRYTSSIFHEEKELSWLLEGISNSLKEIKASGELEKSFGKNQNPLASATKMG